MKKYEKKHPTREMILDMRNFHQEISQRLEDKGHKANNIIASRKRSAATIVKEKSVK